MSNFWEKSRDQEDILDLDIVPKDFIQSIGPQEIRKLGDPNYTLALAYVFQKWLRLIDDMKRGLADWLVAAGEIEASKACYDIWYRGAATTKVEYCLTPKAQRHQRQKDDRYNDQQNDKFSLFSIEHERTMFLDFERLSTGMHTSQTPKYWSTYFQMQHYGMPTRLLDWTEAFLVALYFAVNTSKARSRDDKEKYAIVLVIFPQLLNFLKTSMDRDKTIHPLGLSPDYQVEDKPPFFPPNSFRFTVDSQLDWDKRTEDKPPLDDYQITKGDESAYPELPAALWPSYQDMRMRAQRSVFTIHGRREGGFKAAIVYGRQYTPFAKKLNTDGLKSKPGIQLPLLGLIRIEKNDPYFIDKLWNQIIDSGISESTAFPDLEHLSQELTGDFSPRGRKGNIPKWRRY